jgi:hypothetical protein
VCRLADLKETIGKLAAVLLAAPTSKLQAVYAKYSNKKFMKIARYVLPHRISKGKNIPYLTISVGESGSARFWDPRIHFNTAFFYEQDPCPGCAGAEKDGGGTTP